MLDFEDSMLCVNKVGFVDVSIDVKVEKADVAQARLPSTRYGRTDREAYNAARCGESVLYHL